METATWPMNGIVRNPPSSASSMVTSIVPSSSPASPVSFERVSERISSANVLVARCASLP